MKDQDNTPITQTARLQQSYDAVYESKIADIKRLNLDRWPHKPGRWHRPTIGYLRDRFAFPDFTPIPGSAEYEMDVQRSKLS